MAAAKHLPGDIRQRIRELSYINHISQDKIAQSIGISPSKLSRFLREETSVLEPELIIKIAKLFHVSADFLLGMTDDRIPIDYDLHNLQLSGTAIRKLVTGEVEPNVVSQMIEHDLAAPVTHRIREIQDDEVREALNTAAKLSEQIVTSCMSDDPYSSELDTELIQMKKDAKSYHITREDVYLRQQALDEMADILYGNVLCKAPYHLTREEELARYELYDRIEEAQEKFCVGFNEGYRVEPLFRLWVQLCKVIHAPKRIQSLLEEALYEAFDKKREREA